MLHRASLTFASAMFPDIPTSLYEDTVTSYAIHDAVRCKEIGIAS